MSWDQVEHVHMMAEKIVDALQVAAAKAETFGIAETYEMVVRHDADCGYFNDLNPWDCTCQPEVVFEPLTFGEPVA